jgi:muramoyltetrapeptide carboxypeptidase
MPYQKPKKLKKGDVIGIISPASSPENLKLIDSGINYLERLGYRIETGKNIRKYHGYLAGTDEERVEDIHQMFRDKKVKAIFCIRGGYGAFRLLNKLNYKLIRSNPKIFVGFSDITSLHMAFLQKANLISFAGPMLVTNFSNEISPYTEENFWRTITSNKKLGKLKFPDQEKLPSITSGITTGQVIGGNLAVLTALLGTGFVPSFKGKILLLEDINELPYKMDRMLKQLELNGVLRNLKGIILGRFVKCQEEDLNKRTLTLGEIIDDYLRPLKIPTVYTFPHGHIDDFLTIPIGLKVKLNATKGSVEFMESAIR